VYQVIFSYLLICEVNEFNENEVATVLHLITVVAELSVTNRAMLITQLIYNSTDCT